MKYGQFPFGPPRLIVVHELPAGLLDPFPWTREEQNPFQGLLLCRVLPPQEGMKPPELPPLLPYYSERNKKLYFPLCAACADKQIATARCQHGPEQRSWIAGFTHLELNKAITLGYQVLDVYEVCVKN